MTKLKTFDITKLPPTHPGKLLTEEMRCRNLSQLRLALQLGIDQHTVSNVARGRNGISVLMAMRLGRAFGTGAQLWLNLQMQYDLAVAERDFGAKVDEEVTELDDMEKSVA